MKTLALTTCALALATLGCAGLGKLRLSPDLAAIHVMHLYPGAEPDAVEQMVAVPVEATLQGEPGVVSVDAWSFEGASVVSAWHDPTQTDSAALRMALYERLGSRQDMLPVDAQGGWLRIGGIEERLVARMAVSGGDGWSDCARDLATAAQRVPGVEEARLTGHPYQRLALRVDPVRLATWGLSLEQLREALDPQIVLPPGTIRAMEPPVVERPEELMASVVAVHEDQPVHLRDLATASLERDPGTERVLADSLPAALLTVFRQPTADEHEVRATLHDALEGAVNGCAQGVGAVDLHPEEPVLVVELDLPPAGNEQEAASMLTQLAADLGPAHVVMEIGRPPHAVLNTVDCGRARLLLRFEDALPESALERLAAQIEATPSLVLRTWEGREASRMTIIVTGPDREAVVNTAAVLRGNLDPPGTTAVNDGGGPVQPEIRIHPDRARLAALGLTQQQVALAARMATSCLPVSQAAIPSGFVPASLCIGDATETATEAVQQATLQGPSGVVPLSAVADIEITASPSALWRHDMRPAVRLTITSSHPDDSAVREAAFEAMISARLTPGVTVEIED